MKILVFCPTYRLEPETVDAIFAIDWPSDVLDVHFTRWNPSANDDRLPILFQYSRGRRLALAGLYDAMLTIESDIIPPPDILQKLTAHDAVLAAGLYMFRRSLHPACSAVRFIPGAKWPDQSYSVLPGGMAEIWGKTVRTSGIGLGCSLIHRHVLEKINFRDGHHTHCDWTHAADCLAEGFRMVCDTSVLCGHKCPDGSILWPTEDGKGRTTQGITGPESIKWHTPPAKKDPEQCRQQKASIRIAKSETSP